MTRRGWQRLFRACSVSLTLLLVVASLWFMPLLERRDSELPDYDELQAFDPAREGGHLLPNLDQWMRGEGNSRARIITNSKGFRNRKEFQYAVSANTCRILMLGDSFVDGMRTDQDATIGAVLEGFLKDHAAKTSYADFEVMISGHNNPVDAWFAYQEHGRKYTPTLVVLGVTLGNDFSWQGYRRWMKPILRADGSAGLQYDGSSRELAPENSALLLPPQAFEPESTWDYVAGAEMKARRFFSDRFGFAGYSIPLFTAPWWSRRRHVFAADVFLSLGLFYQPLMPEVAVWFQDFDSMLAGFAGDVERSGSRLLVLIFPERLQVNPEDWALTKRAYCLDASAFDLDYPNRRIKASSARLNVPVLDLTDAFRDHVHSGDGQLYRPRGDMHFSELGQRLAATMVGQYFLEH